MAAFPKTKDELEALGYQYHNTGQCRSAACNQKIEWWATPLGKRIPLNPGTLEPHWATCPDADKLRSKKS